jgi:hypothetical protein
MALPNAWKLKPWIALTCAALLMAGCGQLKGTDLAQLPEASLMYPGSSLVQTITNDSTMVEPEAQLTQIYEVDAPVAQIATY